MFKKLQQVFADLKKRAWLWLFLFVSQRVGQYLTASKKVEAPEPPAKPIVIKHDRTQIRATPGMVPMPRGGDLTEVTKAQAQISVDAMKRRRLQVDGGRVEVEQLVMRVGGDNPLLERDLNILAQASEEAVFTFHDEELEALASFWHKHRYLRPIRAAAVLETIHDQQAFREGVRQKWLALDPLEQITLFEAKA